MSIYCHVIKDAKAHFVKKEVLDTLAIAYDLEFMFSYLNNRAFEGEVLQSLSVNIARAKTQISQDNEEQFELIIQGAQSIELVEADFSWAGLSADMQSLMYVNYVSEENSRLLLEFMREYLKINTETYLWFEGDRIFSGRDLNKLLSCKWDCEWYLK